MHTKASTGKIRHTYEFIEAHRSRRPPYYLCEAGRGILFGVCAWVQASLTVL
jgi:hypothetical protein